MAKIYFPENPEDFHYYKLSDINHDGVQYPGAVVQKNGAVYADQIIWGKVTIDGNAKDEATTEDVLTALENSGSIDPQDLWGDFVVSSTVIPSSSTVIPSNEEETPENEPEA